MGSRGGVAGAGRGSLPGGGEQVSVDPSKGGQSDRDGHHPGEHPQQLLPKSLQQQNANIGGARQKHIAHRKCERKRF